MAEEKQTFGDIVTEQLLVLVGVAEMSEAEHTETGRFVNSALMIRDEYGRLASYCALGNFFLSAIGSRSNPADFKTRIKAIVNSLLTGEQIPIWIMTPEQVKRLELKAEFNDSVFKGKDFKIAGLWKH